MLHRIFPQANSSLTSLAQISVQVAEAAALLSEMVGSSTSEYPELFDRMLVHEANSTDLFFMTLTTVRSSFSGSQYGQGKDGHAEARSEIDDEQQAP